VHIYIYGKHGKNPTNEKEKYGYPYIQTNRTKETKKNIIYPNSF
jgi:hypothetical protein